MKGSHDKKKDTNKNNSLSLSALEKLSKRDIINQALLFHANGNIQKATELYQYFIKQGFSDAIVFSNYGIIMKRIGKIKEAELLMRKAIGIKPDLAQAHLNLGNILNDIGNLKEAELSIRKAIDLKPNLVEAHYNLGNILKDIGNLKEAELSIRKAIDLKPDLAEAHYNLGNILKDIGNLKEAELSIRKAIDLKPDLAEAHYNLGNILKDIGNLKEAELFILKAISIKPSLEKAHFTLGIILENLGKFKAAEIAFIDALKKSRKENRNSIYYNLGIHYRNIGNISKSNDSFKLINEMIPSIKLSKLIALSINYIIQGNLNQASINIHNSKQLINETTLSSFDKIVEAEHMLTWFTFIFNLIQNIKIDDKNIYQNVPHIGDSHSMTFAHKKIKLSAVKKNIQPILILGAKAWHFATKEDNKYKSSFKEQIRNYINSNEIFISFGDIDCRENEGIIHFSIKQKKDFIEVAKTTIIKYIDYMEINLIPIFKKRYYFGFPAPKKTKENLSELAIKRRKLTKLFNQFLKKEVIKRGSYFIDVYELTADEYGNNNDMYMCDNTHLSPDSISILFKNHLYKV